MTHEICEPLAIEDYVVQSMPDVSPTKWHLAHTTWFFEHFILKAHCTGYREFHPRYDYLFNSYYETAGPMHPRPERGLLTRPTVDEVFEYRAYVDAQMQALLETCGEAPEIGFLATLGINHEQQHQELMFTDIKHVLSCNSLLPAYRPFAGPRPDVAANGGTEPSPLQFMAFDGGVVEIGAGGDGFRFDNETPRHRVYLTPFALADRLISNAEYRAFVRDGGYRRPELWLAEGWASVTDHGWTRPLYWSEGLDAAFTLAGLQPLDPRAPVAHLSYYEADAFARWAGARLPSEAEWEVAAAQVAVAGNLLDRPGHKPVGPHPRPPGPSCNGLRQLLGDVWEWTASPYAAYPGFKPLAGTLGEYNGKFMCSQLVLRGGSCATPFDHVRATYRNFFYPSARWQFSGLRLARDPS